MRRLAWLTLGLLACGCGGRVVGMLGVIGSDGGPTADVGPPQRGATDAPAIGEVAPPVDAITVVDVGRTPDVAPPVDAPVDRPRIVDAAPDVVVTIPCQVTNNNGNCPAGTYCQSANCVTGTCVAAPASDQQTPVCGCDRITYWNTSLAATNQAAVRIDGACPNGMACGGPNGINCPAGSLCNLEVADTVACTMNNPTGRCWVLPATCPPIVPGTGPTTRRCNNINAACQTVCMLIAAGRTYFVDPNCPQ